LTSSGDGRFLYFIRLVSEGAGVYRFSIEGRRAERLADLKDFRHTRHYGFWFGPRRQDNPLLLRGDGSDKIYALAFSR